MNIIGSFFTRIDAYIDRIAVKLEGKTVKLYVDTTGAVLFLLFAVAVLLLMPSQIAVSEDESVTARTFPQILMGIIIVFSSITLIKEIIKIIRKEPLRVTDISVLAEIKVAVMLVLLVLYAVLMGLIGFLWSSILFCVALLYFFRIKKWNYYVITVAAAITISIVFKYVLNVRLP